MIIREECRMTENITVVAYCEKAWNVPSGTARPVFIPR